MTEITGDARPELFGHPFSSYCQKALVALDEKGIDFIFRMLGPDHPENVERLAKLWPVGRFPVLVDHGQPLVETSVIIEHLEARHPDAPRLIPADPAAAIEVRMLDRIFDHYVMSPMQEIVGDRLRPDAERDPARVERSRTLLDTAYGWIAERITGRAWAAGDAFTLADCAAAPALFYADWIHPIGERFPALAAYRARLLARPSMMRAVDAARPYRMLFPGGAPDRD